MRNITSPCPTSRASWQWAPALSCWWWGCAGRNPRSPALGVLREGHRHDEGELLVSHLRWRCRQDRHRSVDFHRSAIKGLVSGAAEDLRGKDIALSIDCDLDFWDGRSNVVRRVIRPSHEGPQLLDHTDLPEGDRVL